LGVEVSAEDRKRPFIEMSGRKGVGVKIDDLIDALQSKATEAVREGSKREGLTDDEIEQLGRMIAIGAIRYFMLKFGRNKIIAFDFSEALTFEGDSGPYLQYSTVRVQNIFRKMKERGVDARLDAASLDALTLREGLNDEMWELVRRITVCRSPRRGLARAVSDYTRVVRVVAEIQFVLSQVSDPQ